jgi:hypothetical protein
MADGSSAQGNLLKYVLMGGILAATLLLVSVGLGVVSQISAPPVAEAPPDDPDGEPDPPGATSPPDGEGSPAPEPGDDSGEPPPDPGPGPVPEPEPEPEPEPVDPPDAGPPPPVVPPDEPAPTSGPPPPTPTPTSAPEPVPGLALADSPVFARPDLSGGVVGSVVEGQTVEVLCRATPEASYLVAVAPGGAVEGYLAAEVVGLGGASVTAC